MNQNHISPNPDLYNTEAEGLQSKDSWLLILLFVICLAIFAMVWYWGFRSGQKQILYKIETSNELYITA